ncbi:hypothetical protein ABIA33_006934 [Streptacidiphilus sp. MAP12-16]
MDDTCRRQMSRQFTVQESRHKLARDMCHVKRGTLTMSRAVVHETFGGPKVLELREVTEPHAQAAKSGSGWPPSVSTRWTESSSRCPHGGATFTARATNLSSGKLSAVPGVAGDLWIAGGGKGLLHSTDGGRSFTTLSSVQSASAVGFGKAAPGSSYQALYLIGTVKGVAGVFRSTDKGATWLRINDDAHQWGNSVPPGQHVFAGQHNHATGGRDAKDDTCRADAGTAAGALALRGGLAPPG